MAHLKIAISTLLSIAIAGAHAASNEMGDNCHRSSDVCTCYMHVPSDRLVDVGTLKLAIDNSWSLRDARMFGTRESNLGDGSRLFAQPLLPKFNKQPYPENEITQLRDQMRSGQQRNRMPFPYTPADCHESKDSEYWVMECSAVRTFHDQQYFAVSRTILSNTEGVLISILAPGGAGERDEYLELFGKTKSCKP